MCLSGCCNMNGLTRPAIKRIADSIKAPAENNEIAPSASHTEDPK